MADTVLDLATQLGKGVLIAFRNEDGVIAKTSLTTAFLNDSSAYYTFK